MPSFPNQTFLSRLIYTHYSADDELNLQALLAYVLLGMTLTNLFCSYVEVAAPRPPGRTIIDSDEPCKLKTFRFKIAKIEWLSLQEEKRAWYTLLVHV